MPDVKKRRGTRKECVGFVISNAMDKTIIVKVERRVHHPVYGKEIRRSTKCHVHDENNQGKVGDKVRIAETRPLSCLKRWRLVEILKS